MKKLTIVIIIVAVLIIISVIGYLLYSEYRKIQAISSLEVETDSVRIRDINPTLANVEVRLNISNPTDVSLTLNKISYTLYLEDHSVASGSITKEIRLPVKNEITIPIDVTIYYRDLSAPALELFRKIMTERGKIELTWKVKVSITASTLFGEQTGIYETIYELQITR